jgi:hypothetical protein
VRAATEGIMILASTKLDLNNKLDNDMFNHVIYVSNRILMLSKKEGISKETGIKMGKYLWRLFRVFQAYSEKKREVTLDRIVGVVKEFKVAFG